MKIIEVKTSTSVSPISSDLFLMIVACLFKSYLVFGVVLPWISAVPLLLPSVPSIRSKFFFFYLYLGYIHSGNRFGTVYYFLVH